MTTFSEILSMVVENGRVERNDDGSLNCESLEVEVAFEASEEGLDAAGVQAAIQFAREHTDCN